jgi:hypothetical protein
VVSEFFGQLHPRKIEADPNTHIDYIPPIPAKRSYNACSVEHSTSMKPGPWRDMTSVEEPQNSIWCGRSNKA